MWSELGKTKVEAGILLLIRLLEFFRGSRLRLKKHLVIIIFHEELLQFKVSALSEQNLQNFWSLRVHEYLCQILILKKFVDLKTRLLLKRSMTALFMIWTVMFSLPVPSEVF